MLHSCSHWFSKMCGKIDSSMCSSCWHVRSRGGWVLPAAVGCSRLPSAVAIFVHCAELKPVKGLSSSLPEAALLSWLPASSLPSAALCCRRRRCNRRGLASQSWKQRRRLGPASWQQPASSMQR
jgi:hypothetical protein